jgi:glutamine synthetase
MEGVSTLGDLTLYLDANDIRYHKMAVFDIDGIMRGKYVERKKFLSAVESGFGFCDVVLGWDSNDALYDNTAASGWHTGYRDAPVTIDIDTLRRMPFEDSTVLVIGGFSGTYADVCPRGMLVRTLARAKSMGFDVKSALEYEFFLFDETPESVRAKGYRNLKTLTPGMFGYSMIRSSVHADLHRAIIDTMRDLDCEIEALHTETGPGVIEAAIRVDDALRAADKAALFKTFMKVLAQRRGLMATFMAKWNASLPGQSGHIHVSLTSSSTGDSAFHDPAGRHSMSATMESFVAGQVKYMPEALAMVCSTINAYRRMVPGMWAPTAAHWGVENRTTALRVIPGSPKSQRSEYRIGPADANPYLALSAAIATGLMGIEEGLKLEDPVEGSAYDVVPTHTSALPTTLKEATDRFSGSAAMRKCFGDAFVDHFAATRYWEDREFRKHVADWDLARYFEII